jgi:DNA-binding ferritin-like protein
MPNERKSEELQPLPVKDPYSGLHSESVYAMWHDPMTYDHMKMGPPYLPELKVRMASTDRDSVRALVKREAQTSPVDQILSHLIGEYQGLPMAELGALLACLRAAAMVHQTHHWQTRGLTFYGDHLLYMRLYEESSSFVDQVAERAVGAGSHLLVHPVIQTAQIQALVKHFCGDILTDPSPDAYALVSLTCEARLLTALNGVYGMLEQKGQLSNGTDNLLQGVADKHEEFVYLLKQRCLTKVSYDRRSSAK